MPFAAREAIRQRDPALFERLLGRGVFDPREDRLAEALQTELLRLGCYDGRIDGAWGAGSERAVERWRDAAQIEIAAAAGVPLYRAILRGGEVTCPEIARPAPAVAAPAAPRQPRAGAGGGAGRAAAVKRRPAAAQQPAQPAQKPGTVTINPKFTGAGIYR
ncbi:hypothetical protein IT41_11055 [Paracoccus halophilus]|nr:hypothetical protein IT41_11055 [Paracoccus halophilus]